MSAKGPVASSEAVGDFPDAAHTIDMTPSWGEVGLLVWRLAISGETKALDAVRDDFAKVFAAMEAVKQLKPTFTPEQNAIFKEVMSVEISKQTR